MQAKRRGNKQNKRNHERMIIIGILYTFYGGSAISGTFLADPASLRTLVEVPENAEYVVTGDNGRKYVPCGTIYPANNASAIGIVYEDVEVSCGSARAPVVIAGKVFANRLPAEPTQAAKSSMKAITFINEKTVTRP